MRNNANFQTNLPPMEVRKVDSASKPVREVDSAPVRRVDSIDLLSVALKAAERVHYYDKEMADIFKLSPSLYAKSFDADNDTHNRPMKMPLPKEFAEAFVRVMAEMLGLRIGGSEQRERAFAELMQACTNVIKAGQL